MSGWMGGGAVPAPQAQPPARVSAERGR